MAHAEPCSIPPSLLFTLPLQRFTHAGAAGFLTFTRHFSDSFFLPPSTIRGLIDLITAGVCVHMCV